MTSIHRLAPVVLTLLIVLNLIGVVASGFHGDYQAQIQHEYEKAQAYCYQAYGDSAVINSQVVGGHGGFHCMANDGDPHYHGVTDRAKMAAYYANESNRTVDRWPDDRYQPWHQRGYWPLVAHVAIIVAVTGLVLGVVWYGPGKGGADG